MSVNNNGNSFSADSIVATLARLPGDLYLSDCKVNNLENILAELEETLQIAEINASLNAPDGKNESARELNRKKSIAENPTVQNARKVVRSRQAELEEAKTENKMIARQFAAWCHIAEVESARMILMSKGVSK